MTTAAPSSQDEPTPGMPQIPATGHPGVDAALRLAVSDTDDPAMQLAALTAAHEAVAEILTSAPTDQAPIPGMGA